jgi:heme ABC exporter ATP-binding subunit CcmA
MTARLACQGASWAADSRYVLLDVELALHPGEVVALTGANGAGKSTLLDLLAGTQPPANGRVSLDGVALADIDPGHLACRIARLGHKPGLYLDLSALENLRLFAALLGRPVDLPGLARRLDQAGIDRRDQDRPVRAFSRGMLQRTALARVQASGADVWLLDEPSTGLDIAGSTLLTQVLQSARGQGTAVLIATHDPDLLRTCDRRLHLEQGRLTAEAA